MKAQNEMDFHRHQQSARYMRQLSTVIKNTRNASALVKFQQRKWHSGNSCKITRKRTQTSHSHYRSQSTQLNVTMIIKNDHREWLPQATNVEKQTDNQITSNRIHFIYANEFWAHEILMNSNVMSAALELSKFHQII